MNHGKAGQPVLLCMVALSVVMNQGLSRYPRGLLGHGGKAEQPQQDHCRRCVWIIVSITSCVMPRTRHLPSGTPVSLPLKYSRGMGLKTQIYFKPKIIWNNRAMTYAVSITHTFCFFFFFPLLSTGLGVTWLYFQLSSLLMFMEMQQKMAQVHGSLLPMWGDPNGLLDPGVRPRCWLFEEWTCSLKICLDSSLLLFLSNKFFNNKYTCPK